MNVGLVKAQHALWSLSLGSYLLGQGNIPESVLTDARQCQLGRWLAEQQLATGRLSGDLADLKRLHQELHNLGKQIVDLKHRNDLNGARRLLAEIDPLSTRIMALIDRVAAQSIAKS